MPMTARKEKSATIVLASSFWRLIKCERSKCGRTEGKFLHCVT
jgi:hypothetical protein